MSSSDYIQLLRKRAMKNQAVILSTGNTAALNYATYLDQKDLAAIDNECFSEKTFNGITLNPGCVYAPNTYNGVQHVNQPIHVYNNDVGLAWRACDGSFNTSVNYFSTHSAFATGVTHNFNNFIAATNNNPDIAAYGSSPSPFCVEWFGYVFTKYNTTYTFEISVSNRDNILLWVGNKALVGQFTFNNPDIKIYRNPADGDYSLTKTQTVNIVLPPNTYVPIRIQYDNSTGYDRDIKFGYKIATEPAFIYSSTDFYYYTDNFSILPKYMPLKSTPSIPAKLQSNNDSCNSCTSFRRHNIKKTQNLSIFDSTTFKMKS